MGQPLTIDNHPGAGGQLGLTLIAQAATDGYTIGCGQGGNMVLVPLAHKKFTYDSYKDFAMISLRTAPHVCTLSLVS